jgi:hypothetical protein
MPVGNSGNDHFPYLATRSGEGAIAGNSEDDGARKPGEGDTAEKFGRLYRYLRNAGAYGAADRLRTVDTMVENGELNFEGLERHIDPDRMVDELNSARGRVCWGKLARGEWRNGLRPLAGFPKSARYAHLLRNVAALAPLIFTWIMLGLAAQQYSREIKADPQAANEPFLLLWQRGFGTGFWSFELVTIIDFSVLALVALLTFWVHWAEGQADRSAELVYEAMDSLEGFVAETGVIPNSLTPGNFAREASILLSKTVRDISGLNEANKTAIEEAGDRLERIQDAGQSLVKDLHDKTLEFESAVLRTLTSVTDQNEIFIENTRESNQQVLQALVEQQMQPLLQQVQDMLDEFRSQQADYAAGVKDLTRGVGAIQVTAQGLAASAGQFTESTTSIAQSLRVMADSQKQYAAGADESARSMRDAAKAMAELKDAFGTQLHGQLKEMVENVTGASTSLSKTQEGLATTTGTMRESATAFTETLGKSAGAFAESTGVLAATLSETTVLLRQSAGSSGPVRPRRRWWRFWRRS